MAESEELLNLYDRTGRVTGQAPRRAAKASGRVLGAVNALIVNLDGRVLLQQRLGDKENGGLWDKSVGGHVSAGEDFDRTLLREAGEELFDDPDSSAVVLAPEEAAFTAQRRALDLAGVVLLRRQGLQLNLRDVRRLPGPRDRAANPAFRNVSYHVAVYLGCTALALERFRPQAREIAALRYFTPAEVDGLLLQGGLAPNMAWLWLSQAQALFDL